MCQIVNNSAVDYSISLKCCIGHPKCCKCSRSRGQRSRSQPDITCAKIRKIINNSAEHRSISFKFSTYFDHVTLDVSWTFKVNGSKFKVTAWHNVSASKNAIIESRTSCRRSNFVKIIQERSATLETCSRSLSEILKKKLRRGLLDCVQIWYRVSSRHRRYTANV